MSLLAPADRLTRRWPSRAVADEGRRGWAEVCSDLWFVLQASILGLKRGHVP